MYFWSPLSALDNRPARSIRIVVCATSFDHFTPKEKRIHRFDVSSYSSDYFSSASSTSSVMSIKFVLSKIAVAMFVVVVPFLVALGHGYRLFFTKHTNPFDNYPKNCHQIVNFVLVLAGIRFRPIARKCCGINLYVLLTVLIGGGSAFASIVNLESYLTRKPYVAIELITSILSLVLLVLGWDEYERPSPNHESA